MEKLTRRELLVLLASAPAWAQDWPHFRGDGTSLASDSSLPLHWPADGNIAWRADLPGYGQSSPVIWDETAYLTSAEGKHKEQLHVVAIATDDGSARWRRTIGPAQPIEDSDMVSKAAPTPIVDSHGVCAFFETGNLVAFDHDGSPQWQRRLTEEYGVFRGRHGIGSSLGTAKAGIIVLAAHDGPSYLLCVDRQSGETVWKTERSPGVCWSTPTVVVHEGLEIVLVAAGDRLEAFAANDGRPLWTLGGLKGVFLPSPTPVPGGAIIASGEKGQTFAARFPAPDENKPEVLWRAEQASAYFGSPLVCGGHVYMVNKAGVAFCLHASTGAEMWHARLAGPCWASPVGTGDRVYFFGVDGVTQVIRVADDFEVIAENTLDEQGRLYGVAVSGSAFFARYGRRLIKIARAGS